jgi:hypothetical protein
LDQNYPVILAILKIIIRIKVVKVEKMIKK